MNKIYILKKHKLIKGPYKFDYLKKVGLKDNDLVWYEGLADWTPVKDIDVLASISITGSQMLASQKNSSLMYRFFNFLNKAI
jgi:hypothetical protein